MKKILLVDDEPGLVMLTKSRLKANGFEVITGGNGDECLQKAAAEKPDLILLDVMMPKIDGYETLMRLKREKTTMKIPVIMFSAKVMESEIKRAKELGAFEYIVKPFDPALLLQTIQAAISSEH